MWRPYTPGFSVCQKQSSVTTDGRSQNRRRTGIDDSQVRQDPTVHADDIHPGAVFTRGGKLPAMCSASPDRATRVVERVIEARVHGRYLVRSASDREAAGLLVGFHGYAQDAAIHLNALSAIPDVHAWLV